MFPILWKTTTAYMIVSFGVVQLADVVVNNLSSENLGEMDPASIMQVRHSFRDRLRAVEAPVDLIDQLGGWSLQSVGQGYGDGYPLTVLQQWMLKLEQIKRSVK